MPATADRRRAVTLPLGDFSVQYEWRAAPLPPPHHWQYTIRIGVGGDSELVVVPDYPSASTPVWSERFTLAREHMEWLYRTMLERGLLSGGWHAAEIPVGGGAEWMTVHGGGIVVEIPAYVESGRAEAAAAMCGAVKALVPRELWQRMDGARQQYVSARAAELHRDPPPVVTQPASGGVSPRLRVLMGVIAVVAVFGTVMIGLAILLRLTR
ncbi:MAG: hypothetical protein ABJD07_04340 [Gemmatimonadaceae bacterium]